jgi:hypothetical protein
LRVVVQEQVDITLAVVVLGVIAVLLLESFQVLVFLLKILFRFHLVIIT